jgi:hypothetical protein
MKTYGMTREPIKSIPVTSTHPDEEPYIIGFLGYEKRECPNIPKY